MKFLNLYLLIFLFISSGINAADITLRMFGAKGDGKTDDTQAFKTALLYAQKNKETINGENLIYFLSGRLELTLEHFSLSNCNFITSEKYSNQFSIKINSDKVCMTNVSFDGGRNTYKGEIESWKEFSQENSTISIYPITEDLFYFVGLNKNATMIFKNIRMNNIHASSCITVVTLGNVLMSNLQFRNISNKTYHIYHSVDEGKSQSGSTRVESVIAEDVGILPCKLRINETVFSHEDIKYMPQSSFNFIVSFGKYYLKNAFVRNYGSSGITSDRNTLFHSEYISIKNDSDKTFSNNPSGAMWFEATSNINMKRVDIDIEDRDERDLLFDSSAFHIYGVNTIGFIDSLYIKGKKLNKGIRGSFEGNNKITFNNIMIEGEYKQATVLMSMMPNSKIETQISMGNLIFQKGVVEFYGIRTVSINNATGMTGNESINFKLPYMINNNENYYIKRTNIKNVFQNNAIKRIEVYNYNNKRIPIKKLN